MTPPGAADAGEVRIEPVARPDVDAIAALAREIWQAHYPDLIGQAQIDYMLEQRYRPALVRAELERDDLWWDKLIVGSALAGFASYFLTEDGRTMKLDKLYVHPRHQRRGYGGRLIDRALARARTLGCERLLLAVNRRNATAIAAYRKHGFRVAEKKVTDIGGGFVMDDFIMVRKVTNACENKPLDEGVPERGSAVNCAKNAANRR